MAPERQQTAQQQTTSNHSPTNLHWHSKSVIITGAASGIGKALAGEMINRGAVVWLTDINPEVVAIAECLGANAKGFVLDVSDSDAFKQVIEQLIASTGKIDYLFNNAGIGFGCDTVELSTAHYDRYIDINIRGVTNGVSHAYPIMVKQGFGTIVNTASVGGLLPSDAVFTIVRNPCLTIIG